jgi:hypothetical protein
MCYTVLWKSVCGCGFGELIIANPVSLRNRREKVSGKKGLFLSWRRA